MNEIEIRPYDDDRDRPAVLGLLNETLGWVPDEHHEAYFVWKHRSNPFGPSPAWVAVDGDRIAGFRTFLRWEFEREGVVVPAARAVDTATHPSYQRRGIFSRLTLHGLVQLRAEGTAFIFNTPNDRSLPGYLSMGWKRMGHLPVRMRPSAITALPRVLRSRVAAERWSTPTDAGRPAADLLTQPERLVPLLATGGVGRGGLLRTRRTAEYLAWRYRFPPLGYRSLLLGPEVEDGVAFFRLRRRGTALEAAVCDVLRPPGQPRLPGLARAIARTSGADYVVALGRAPLGDRMLPLPGVGPVLAWRSVTEGSPPALGDWDLSLGDVELL